MKRPEGEAGRGKPGQWKMVVGYLWHCSFTGFIQGADVGIPYFL